MPYRFKWPWIIAVLICFYITVSSRAADINSVRNSTVNNLKTEQDSQKNTDKWYDEKQKLVNDILEQKTKFQWNIYQNKKYRQYIERKRDDVAELQRQKEKMQQLRMSLEPYLDATVQNLKGFVATDLPFLSEERSDRINFLKDSLSDPELALSEKLRRVLEALKVEAQYGNNIEVTSEKLNLHGKEILVDMLRLGRVALFYLTRDDKNIGMWDRDKKSWIPIGRHYTSDLRLAMDVAQHKRAAELVKLPLGRIN